MPITSVDLEIAKYWQEWWKVAVSAVTPIAIVGATWFVTNALNVRQSVLRTTEQILSKKQKIYSKIDEDINVIYVYCNDIEDFRQYTPDQIIERKRNSDRMFNMYQPYWSKKTQDDYNAFITSAFEVHGENKGIPALIKTSMIEKESAFKFDGKPWDLAWNARFTGMEDPEIRERYYTLVDSFIKDITNPT